MREIILIKHPLRDFRKTGMLVSVFKDYSDCIEESWWKGTSIADGCQWNNWKMHACNLSGEDYIERESWITDLFLSRRNMKLDLNARGESNRKSQKYSCVLIGVRTGHLLKRGRLWMKQICLMIWGFRVIWILGIHIKGRRDTNLMWGL